MIARARAWLAYLYDACDAVVMHVDELPGDDKADIAALAGPRAERTWTPRPPRRDPYFRYRSFRMLT